MKLKGIVTLVVRDKDSGAIKRVVTEDNVIAHTGMDLLNSSQTWPAISGGSTQRISISPRRAGEAFEFAGWSTFGELGSTSPAGPLVTIVDKTPSTPYYVEFLNRFNPPASIDRIIWSIALCDNFAASSARTVAYLTTACTQLTTEILDVYYRIQTLEPAADAYSFELPTDTDKAWAEWIAGVNSTSGLHYVTPNLRPGGTTQTQWTAYPVAPGKFYKRYTSANAAAIVSQNSLWSNGPTSINYGRYGQFRWSDANAITRNVGRILRSFIPARFITGDSSVFGVVYINPAVPEGFQPVQPIHNHNSSGIQPFLDVSALASGTGTVNATGTNWYETNFPEYHRADINATGDVGTSRYTFRKRVISHFGAPGTTYHNFPIETNVLPTGGQIDGEITKYALGDALRKGLADPTNYLLTHNQAYYEKHNEYSVHTFKADAIQLFDIRRGIYRLWDNATPHTTPTPPLLGTGLKQVTSDDDGYIWAACANTGLYKIWGQEFDITAVTPGGGGSGTWTVRGDATPYITATDDIHVELNTGNNTANVAYTVVSAVFGAGVTVITVNETIPANSNATGVLYIDKILLITTPPGPADPTKCHGVSIGINNTIWALFTDGLGQSTNSGVTWTIEAFTYVGITDSSANYGTVQYMRVQKDSAAGVARTAFVRSASGPTTNTVTVVWWSLAAAAGITGPTVVGITQPHVGGIAPMSAPSFFRVSDTGGFWNFGGVVSNGTYLSKLIWGTPVRNITGPNRNGGTSPLYSPFPTYNYDAYNTPYALVFRQGDATGTNSHIYDNLLSDYGRTQFVSGADSTVDARGFLHLYKGMSLQFATNVSQYRDTTNLCVPNVASTTTTLNRDDTQSQEWLWDRYMWDTVAGAWKKEWHADALDSINSFNGTRRQFLIEDHTFTGRSTIQVLASALSTHFTSAFTFSGHVSPTAKLFVAGVDNTGGQLEDQTLVSYIDEADPTNFFHLNLIDTNNLPGGSNIVLSYKEPYHYFATTAAGVDSGTDIVTLEGSHSYSDGDAVRYEKRRGGNTGSAVIGLTDTFLYFVRATGLAANEVTFHPTAADAIANTSKINLTAAGLILEDVEYHFIQKLYVFGSAGILTGSTYNVQLIITGVSASVYVDDVQSGTTVTVSSALDMSPATGRLVIGGRWYHPDQEAFSVTDGMFRGTMENVLLDSAAWAGAQRTAYQAAPLTYAGIASTRVRYQLNEAFTGAAVPGTSMFRETKATHAGFEDTYNGAQIKFTSGVSTPALSFVDTDYYTYGIIKDGILKDNAISFTWNGSVHTYALDNGVLDFTPAIIPGTTTTVTEPVCYRNYGESNTAYVSPGRPTSRMGTGVTYSFQSTTGDLSYKWTMRNPVSAGIAPGFADSTRLDMSVGTTLGTGNAGWELRFNPTGTVDVYESGALISASVDTFDYGDIFEIRRTGTAFTYYKNAGLIHSSGDASAAPCYAWQRSFGGGNIVAGAYNATITYDLPAHMIKIGNSGSFTGWFDPTFYNVDAVALDPSQVSLNGTPVTAITVASLLSTIESIAAPAAGEVTIVPDNGLLIFNPADVGKTVTGQFTVVLNQP